MKRYTRIMCYLISICLCLWYLTVVYWAKHPTVSKEYELFYIKKQLKDWPGYGGLRYNFGEQLFFGTQDNGMQKIKNRGLGWSTKEPWGTWTIGKNAHLYFIINEEITSDLKLTMMSDAFCPDGLQAVDILVNDSMVETLRFKDSPPKEYHVTIPKKLVKKDGWLHIEFIIQKPSSPKQHGLSEDNRMLGLAMHWIKIESKDWPGYGGLRYNFGEQLFFGTQDNGMQKIKNRGLGWSTKEPWGTWTIGKNAHLYFIINEEITSDLKLTMMLDAFCPQGYQLVDILVNDIMVGTLRFKDSSRKEYHLKREVAHVTIPKKIVKKDGLLHLEFIIQKPGSPQQYGLSKDIRMLGIAMRWIKIESMDKNE